MSDRTDNTDNTDNRAGESFPDLNDRFQQLIPEDQATCGKPDVIPVHSLLGEKCSPACQRKVANWIDWYAAPYQAKRHAEYMHVPARPDKKILISAILTLPEGFESYKSQLNRKHRSNILGSKAANLGYTARAIRPREHASGIHDVIHSSNERQGRKVTEQFWNRPKDHGFDDYEPLGCNVHDNIACGVFDPDGVLAAYLLGQRVGELVSYEEIMGHAEHRRNDVMYLLHAEFIRLCLEQTVRPKYLQYGAWYSGQTPFDPKGGLNRWRRKVRMKPAYLILASC